MVTSIANFHKKFYIPAIQNMEFYLPHIQMMDKHAIIRELHEDFIAEVFIKT